MDETNHFAAHKRSSEEDLAQIDTKAPAKRLRKAKPYVPSLKTGPYAIVMALSSQSEDSFESFSKAQVIELAQPHCESSFTVPSEAGKFYTAWNSMTTLINKDLVQERGRPLRKYLLTEEGWEVARRIRAVGTGEASAITNGGKKKDTLNYEEINASKPKTVEKGIHTLVGLEDDPSDLDVLGPRSKILQKPSRLPKDPSPVSSGRRLEQALVDMSGTLSKGPEQLKSKPLSEPNFVELLSSPEPPEIPWPSSSLDQDFRASCNPSGNMLPHSSHTTSTASRPTDATTAPDSIRSHFPNPQSIPSFTPIILPPGSFTVRLVLDNREVRAKDDRDYIADQLTIRSAPPLVRPLPLGDIFWVAKLHDPTFLSRYGEEGDEVALDWIVERKRLDDLVGSITDGRFQEQKFRLRRSGIRNVAYLIEEITLSQEKAQKFSEAITSAIASTQVVNGYFVKRTQKLDDSIRYLARLTNLLKSIYESNLLHIIPTTALSPTTYLPLLTHLRSSPQHKDRNYNITFPAFASLASKSDTVTLRDVFLKMLMCTRGISGDKALAIQKVWSTPRALIEAFEACATQKEKDLMVEKHLGGLVGKGRVKGVLGAKVADIWAAA